MFPRTTVPAVTALLLVALLLVTPLTPSAVPTAAARGDAPTAVDVGTCPAVVVVAARGSEQNDDLRPTRYSTQGPWVSNGFEGPTLRDFLLFAEQRHLERTGGSLLADVAVLALDDAVYPAALPLPALAEAGEELSPPETVRRLGEVLSEAPAHHILGHAGTRFAASVETAAAGVPGVLADFEATSGCSPDYLLLGYSQGAIVLTLQEQWLHEEGRLAGAVYLGNPLLAPGDPGMVLPEVRGGALRGVPPELRPGARTDRRLNYCLPGDFACDLDPGALAEAMTSHAGAHAAYFQPAAGSAQGPGWDAGWDVGWNAAVADQFATWVSGYTSHP